MGGERRERESERGGRCEVERGCLPLVGVLCLPSYRAVEVVTLEEVVLACILVKVEKRGRRWEWLISASWKTTPRDAIGLEELLPPLCAKPL